MLDIDSRPTVASPISFKAIESLNIQISTLADGAVFVWLTATTIDDEEPQLLTQEIASERLATIDDALALIGERVRATMTTNPPAGS
jgi:hypothetical protein